MTTYSSLFAKKIAATKANLDKYSKLSFLEKKFKTGTLMVEICASADLATSFAAVLAYDAAAKKELPLYLSGKIDMPVIYCNARLSSEAGLRLFSELHRSNPASVSKRYAEKNLHVFFRKDYPENFPGFFYEHGQSDIFKIIKEREGILIIDDITSNKEHPYDSDYSWKSISISLKRIAEEGWGIIMVRDINNKDRSKGFDEYLRMIDFRIIAMQAKGGTAQEETRLTLSHKLNSDYIPSLLGTYTWSASHEDGQFTYSIDPSNDSVAERNSEIVAEIASGKSMASVARQFGLNKSTIGRIAGSTE